MNIQQNISLKKYNTFGIDAIAKQFITANSIKELQEIITNKNDIFLLGGGSNMLLTSNISKLVVHLNLKGIIVNDTAKSEVFVTAEAGENWHDFVIWCISQNYGGLENLSLIPGNVGASPIQNIGAYGVEIKDTFHQLEAIEKGGYEHFMLKQIHEQPKTIFDCLRGRLDVQNGEIIMAGVQEHIEAFKAAKRIIVVACGTSWHAGLVAEYIIEELCRIPVEVEYASEFRYRNPVIHPGDVIIAISQSFPAIVLHTMVFHILSLD